MGAGQSPDLRREPVLGRAFLAVSVAFLLLLGFAFYQDLSRPWAPIQEKYAAQYGQDFPIQVQQLFPKVQVNGQFMVERCITCHVPDITKIGPQKGAERLGPNHPSVISDSVFAKYGQETQIYPPATAAARTWSPTPLGPSTRRRTSTRTTARSVTGPPVRAARDRRSTTRTGWASSTTIITTAASTWATRARNTRARSCRRGASTSCSRSRSTPTSTCWCTGSGCGSSTRAVHETPAAQELDRDRGGLRRDRRLDRARDRGGEPARRDQGAQGGRLMVPALVQLINLTRDPGAGDFFFVLIWAVCTLLLVAFYCYRMFQR